MSNAEKYQVVVAGRGVPADHSAAANTLANKLDASADQIAAMLTAPNYVAARDLAHEDAERYAEIFRAVGVEVRVEPEVVKLAINLPPSSSPVPASTEPDTIRRLADYQRISGVLWIVLGIVQLLSVYGIIAGLWNIPVGIGRLRQATRIRARDKTIPAAFEGVVGLVVVGVINLVLGGAIGVIVVGLDFWIRDRVLKHRGLFTEVVPQLDAYARKKLRREARQARHAELLAAPNRSTPHRISE